MIFGLLAALVAALSPRGRLRLAGGLAWLVGGVLRLRRRHVEGAMRRAGIDAGEVATFYRTLAENAVDLLAVAGGASIGARAPRLTDTAMAELRAARATGAPVLIAASHTGNWELAAFALAEEVPVAVVAKRQGNRAADRFVRAVRERHKIALLAPEGALAGTAEALRAGRVVVMPIDQVPALAAHGERGAFLGADAWLDRAPFVLAKRAGATVLVAVVEGPRIHVVATLGAGELARPSDAAREASRLLEAHVRAFPASWLWLHRRWKDLPPRSRSRRSDGETRVVMTEPKTCSGSRQAA